ncbi:alpha/beta hydrolase [Saccharopolyspora sp. NFXS83]|uniref:alpha/beta hydrolase n=1 Tax=Saccharopolyspora sp. NFXS83 TaxID=2993560 RepID=UPI00224AB0EA|nr:alpha/beta hydrolase [Saccharopolyspora sp. NFXS83]MCX2731724.1 alpha/beta hydrolase [Saccharopolyspora sp. NFXS83]
MTTFPTMDPELAAAAAMLPKLDFADLTTARERFTTMTEAMLAAVSYEGITWRELAAPGPEGAPDVSIRFFTPPDAAERDALPTLLWLHGGGFAIGQAKVEDPLCIDLVQRLGIAVASVDYRLAPETPYPGPLQDCYAALRYLHANAAELGVDPERIAVGGQSAGGGLAAGTTLLARDRGEVPVAFQLLEIPELDDRLETRSMVEFVDTPMWNRPNAVLSWQYYLGRNGTAAESDAEVSPYAAPARAQDLRGLPPTYLSTMELDPLRDEGIAYATALLQAGVSVELHSFPGTFHGSSLLSTAAVSVRGAAEVIVALARGLQVEQRSS